MLHDVLRQLRHVGEIDLLSADERLALTQTARDRQKCQRDAEQHHAKHAGRNVVRAGRELQQTAEDLLHEYADGSHGCDQKRVTSIGEHGHGADRQDEQDPQSAGDAATGIQDEGDGDGIHARVHQRDDPQARPVQAPCDDQ